MVPDGCVYLLSVGTYRWVSRTVGVTVRLEGGESQRVHGAIAATSLVLSGGVDLDSYNSDKGSYESQSPGVKADIFTNSVGSGSVQMVGSSYVKGTVHVGPGGKVGAPAPSQTTMNSDLTVWKDWNCYSLGESELEKPISLPEVEVPNLGPSQGEARFDYRGGTLDKVSMLRWKR